MENKVGLVGFLCPKDGRQYEYDWCLTKCQKRCMTLPLLRSLIKEYHTQPKRYSVTEICKPPQVVYLRRNRAYFVNPLNMIWMVFGNAVHSIIADYGHENPEIVDGFRIEEKFEYPVGDCTLVGKADAYDVGNKFLYDYKTIKAYAAKLLKAGNFDDNDYVLQLNMYKWCHFRDAEKLMLETLIKDWSLKIQDEEGLLPVEQIELPILPEAKMISFVTERIVENEKNNTNPGLVRPCTKTEVWFNENPRSKNCGRPVKCDSYCDVCMVCPQYNNFLQVDSENENAAQNNIYPKR